MRVNVNNWHAARVYWAVKRTIADCKIFDSDLKYRYHSRGKANREFDRCITLTAMIVISGKGEGWDYYCVTAEDMEPLVHLGNDFAGQYGMVSRREFYRVANAVVVAVASQTPLPEHYMQWWGFDVDGDGNPVNTQSREVSYVHVNTTTVAPDANFRSDGQGQVSNPAGAVSPIDLWLHDRPAPHE